MQGVYPAQGIPLELFHWNSFSLFLPPLPSPPYSRLPPSLLPFTLILAPSSSVLATRYKMVLAPSLPCPLPPSLPLLSLLPPLSLSLPLPPSPWLHHPVSWPPGIDGGNSSIPYLEVALSDCLLFLKLFLEGGYEKNFFASGPQLCMLKNIHETYHWKVL